MHIRLETNARVKFAVSAILAMALLSTFTACRRPQPPAPAGPPVLIVSVAASLTDSILEIEAAYKQNQPGVDIRNNFGGSGSLAEQIEAGAPVDVFLSAAAKPMDDLDARGLIVAGSRHNLAGNMLVLVASHESKLTGFQGLSEPSVRTIALGDPASVPAGQYGQQTLTALHLFDDVKKKFVLAKDVRQVLAYVESGDADAGIVYATDVPLSTTVRIVAAAPEWTHDPVVYPAAAITSGHHKEDSHPIP